MKKINIIIALIILSIGMNVYADDKNSKNNKSKNKATSSKILHAFDAELKLERWMTEIKEFSFASDSFTEEKMSMENWMLNHFDCCSDFFIEEEINIESWMMESFDLNESSEMALEDWMLQSFKVTNSTE
jgi:hypothetical protein